MINSISIGKFTIYFYSICILLGVILAYLVIMKEAKKKNINISDEKTKKAIAYLKEEYEKN